MFVQQDSDVNGTPAKKKKKQFNSENENDSCTASIKTESLSDPDEKDSPTKFDSQLKIATNDSLLDNSQKEKQVNLISSAENPRSSKIRSSFININQTVSGGTVTDDQRNSFMNSSRPKSNLGSLVARRMSNANKMDKDSTENN